MKHFLSYDSAREISNHIIKLLNTEGYKTEYLEVLVPNDRQGYFIEASSETDPQMVTRFNHLLREHLRTLRSAIDTTL